MSKVVKQIEAVAGLISFVEDIKPYHSKILEVLIEYAHKDYLNVVVKDELKSHESIYFYKPQYFADHGITFNWDVDQCDDIVNVGDGTAIIKTPSSTKDFLTFPVTTDHTFMVLGDFSKVFKTDQTINVSLWQDDNGTRYMPDGVATGTHTQDYTITNLVFVEEQIDYSVVPTDINTQTAGDLAYTLVTVAETLPNFTSTPNKLPMGKALLAPIDIERLADNRSFVLTGNHVVRFTQGVRFEVINGSHPGVFTAYVSTYDAAADETTILTTKYITDDVSNWQRGRIIGKRFGYDSAHGICSNVKPGTHARVSFEDQMVIKDWQFDFKDTLMVHNMENDEYVPYAIGPYNNSEYPEMFGQYDAIPHLVHHEYVEVVDANKAFKVGGGNYIDRFTFTTQFDVSRMGNNNDGFSQEFKADLMGIKNIDTVNNTITISGAYDWLFKVGRIFKVLFSQENNDNYVVVSSGVVNGDTVITVTANDMHSFTAQNPDGSPIMGDNENGAISGAVFEPDPQGDQPATYVCTVNTIVIPNPTNLHLMYYWVGAVHFDIDMVWNNEVKGFFPKDNISIEGHLIQNDVNATTPTTVAAAQIVESLIWGWGDTQSWAVVSVNNTKITIQGDLTNIFTTELEVVGSDKNNGTYNINSTIYDFVTDTTTFNSPGTYFKKTGALGLVQIDNVDISEWFQYLIKSMSTIGTITVQGNATLNIQPNQSIQVYGENAGIYLITNTTFDGINTILTTSTTIASDSNGGVLEPLHHLGMRVQFSDSIGVEVYENIDGLGNEGENGPWDENQWDTGEWDND